MDNIQQYYELLGLKVGASQVEIKQAYRQLVKRWHPDRFPQNPSQQQAAEEKIKQLNEAYQALKSYEPEMKSDPSDRPTTRSPSNRPTYTTAPTSAEVFYDRAGEEAKERNYEEAIECLNAAIRINPNYAEAYRYRGFLYSVLGFERRAEADLRKAKDLGLGKSPYSPGVSSRPSPKSSANRSPGNSSQSTSQAWICVHTITDQSAINSLAIGRSRSLLVSGGEDHTVNLWNLQTYKQIGSLAGHTAPVLSVCLSEDGKLLASGSQDYSIKLWHIETGSLLKTFTGHTAAVGSVVISPDRQILLSGSADRTVQAWHLGSGKLLQTFIGHTASVHAVAISPNGKLFASGSADQSIRLWEMRTGQFLGAFNQRTSPVLCLAINPNSKTLAAGEADGTVKLWDLQTGQLLHRIQGQQGSIQAVAFHPKEQTIASSGNGTIQIWHLTSGKLLNTLSAHQDRVTSLAFSADGSLLISSSRDQTMKVWQRR
ncbi:MAG TPA: DnaJ domain-containing protein [Trichocoleus sp.]|jgi:curved DNA-binding protein CbpA/uncharacterized protein with WD repeat